MAKQQFQFEFAASSGEVVECAEELQELSAALTITPLYGQKKILDYRVVTDKLYIAEMVAGLLMHHSIGFEMTHGGE